MSKIKDIPIHECSRGKSAIEIVDEVLKKCSMKQI
jgi:hypothetical protein